MTGQMKAPERNGQGQKRYKKEMKVGQDPIP